ncbi:hypothetical protein [Arthrobacter sp. 9MFCol3.1]|uniref:hypothetical protein n=1 Tax=Arthrobacter sp. 9MFCol3.1 TaxID=1150398 RepID=UPI00047DF7BF|nr:hypothetical protein [Arthrobacter sp. 9MFCol3.1]
MAALVIGGAILGAVAFFISPLFAPEDTQNLSIWQSILTNFGTGLVSAGLLLLVEPKIRRAVKTSVTRATVDATASIREGIRNEVQDDIEQKFASLEERINSRVQDKLSDQDKKLTDLSKDFTRTAAMAALKSAVDMNSLHNQEIIVQATGKAGELRIGLRLDLPAELRAYTRFDRPECTLDDNIPYLVAYSPDNNGFYSQVSWDENEDFGEVVSNLLMELQRTGRWGLAVPIDWKAVTGRLVTGLKFAAESRRKEPGSPHLQGRLIEVIGTVDPWYLTDGSIENPKHNYVLPRTAFPALAVPRFPGQVKVVEEIAPRPEFADPDEWDYVLGRGSAEFTAQF